MMFDKTKNTGKTAILSCQQFTESVHSYSLLIQSTVPQQFQETPYCAVNCEVIMFLPLNALKCRSHSAEDAGITNGLSNC